MTVSITAEFIDATDKEYLFWIGPFHGFPGNDGLTAGIVNPGSDVALDHSALRTRYSNPFLPVMITADPASMDPYSARAMISRLSVLTFPTGDS